MVAQKKKPSISIMEYCEWIENQKFRDPIEHHKYVSVDDQEFLQYVIYPMFYQSRTKRVSLTYPFVLKEKKDEKYPKYVINNDFFTIIFYNSGEKCWKVSFHIKNHFFCDKRINDFKAWYREHYSKAKRDNDKVIPGKDISFEFWNESRNYLLFKLLDAFRSY